MASFVAKHVVRHIAEAAGCSDHKVDKLGRIAKWTTAVATGDIAGVLADRELTKWKDNKEYVPKWPALRRDDMHHYDSDDDDSDDKNEMEVEGTHEYRSERHHRELADIQPFLEMAMAAYKDSSMEGKFPSVERSQLIRDLEEPSKLRWGIKTDTEVHVCVLNDGTLAFAFRGTEPVDWKCPLGDILTDLSQSQVPLEHYDASHTISYRSCSSVKIHEGFQFGFQDVTKTRRPNENLRLVAEGLGVKGEDVKRVVCIGHSLGGALATLCAHWCRHVAYPQAQIWCVTIGSPRVGNRAFAKEFNASILKKGRSYRVVNKGDLVPSIPHLYTYPKVWSAYKHVEGLIYLSEHPTSKDTIRLKCGGRRPSFVLLSFLDHPCDAYINSIDRVLSAYYKYGPPRITFQFIN